MSIFISEPETNNPPPAPTGNSPDLLSGLEKQTDLPKPKTHSALPLPLPNNSIFGKPTQQISKNIQEPVSLTQKVEQKIENPKAVQAMSDDFLFEINPPPKINQEFQNNQAQSHKIQKPKLLDDDFLSF